LNLEPTNIFNTSTLIGFAGIKPDDVSGILTSYLTVVSFLVGICSFILGLYKAKIVPLHDLMFFKSLILALVVPSAILTLYGIVICIGFSLYWSYLPALGVVIVPIIVISLLMW
jgi:hypothetical protein